MRKFHIDHIFKRFFAWVFSEPGKDNEKISFSNKKDYLFLPKIFTAKKHFYPHTISFLILLFAAFLILILNLDITFNLPLLIILSALISAFYFCLMLFKLLVLFNSKKGLIKISQKEIASLKDKDLPTYTLLIPLARESEVVDQIVEAMTAIDYPAEKLDVIVTLEKDDLATIDALKEKAPSYFKLLLLPDCLPKTKPKALNVAFQYIQGKYVTIYDAEIIPDPDQLKKAVLSFKKYPEISALQTILDHYNPNQSLITRLFNAEFSFHYLMFLPGLQKLGLPVPLSGHSVHFRKEALSRVGAWDPYNVTEDCDIGVRLYRFGYKVGLLDSVSREEATSSLDAWTKQRTRWMKGFIQTSIVHLRDPKRLISEIGVRSFFGFLFVVPGAVVVNLLNFFLLLLLISWFITESTFIQNLFPGPILYISVLSFVFGNFTFTYLNLITLYRKESYSLVKYSLLTPLYWLMLSAATINAVIQVISRPYYWDKTKHGEHIITEQNKNFAFVLLKQLSRIRVILAKLNYDKIFPFLP